MLDRLPAWARHLTIAFAAAFAFDVASTVVDAGGVSGLDAAGVATGALNSALVAAGVVALNYLTPLTRQYGVGSASPDEGISGP